MTLVYRPTLNSNWNDRCKYLSGDYVDNKPYNHRSVLNNEIVIEFDEYHYKTNLAYANVVESRLKQLGFSYSKWKSGNKSIHIHTLLDLGNVKNLSLLKKTFMRVLTDSLILPDLRLAASNHLIRAEFGIHERTRKYKTLLYESKDYPKLNTLPQTIWDEYIRQSKALVRRRLTMDTNELLDNPKVKFILTSEKFREYEDGRERALFMLIHILKPKYVGEKGELTKYVQEWYRYSGGYKMRDEQIAHKVNYHWKRDYNFGENYVNELLESIGVNPGDIK